MFKRQFTKGDKVLGCICELFEIIVSLFENYVMIDFVSRLFGVKKTKYSVKLGFLLTLLVMFVESIIINKVTLFEVFSVFVPVITLFIYEYAFLKGNMFEKLFIAILGMVTLIVINSVTAIFMNIVTGTTIENLVYEYGLYRFIAVVITKVIFFVVTRLFLKFNNANKYCCLNKKEACLILFSPIISIFFASQMLGICVDTQIDRNTSLILMFFFICILLINITNYYLFLKINKNNLSNLKLALLKQEYDYHTQNIEQIKNTYEEMRKMKHDLKNNIFCIMGLLEQKQYEKALTYTVSLSKKIEYKNFFVNTNNKALNGIINLKLSLAKDKNISVDCDITDNIVNIDDIDLTILTANLLDNAIEASQKIDNKNRYIVVNIKNIDGNMVFVIKNKITESVLKNNPKLLTSKNDFNFHGIGNISVRSIVEKYNGSINYYEKDNLFCCEAVLKKLTPSHINA